MRLGLDLTSGTTVALKAQTPKGGDGPVAADMTQPSTSWTEPGRRRGLHRGVGRSSRATTSSTCRYPAAAHSRWSNLVGTTAQLRFRQVLLEAPNTVSATPTPTPLGQRFGHGLALGQPVGHGQHQGQGEHRAEWRGGPSSSRARPGALLAAQARRPPPVGDRVGHAQPDGQATPTSGLATTADAEGARRWSPRRPRPCSTSSTARARTGSRRSATPEPAVQQPGQPDRLVRLAQRGARTSTRWTRPMVHGRTSSRPAPRCPAPAWTGRSTSASSRTGSAPGPR